LVTNTQEIKPGTIVQATRSDGFTTRATYFGYVNNKHIAHEGSSKLFAMLFDSVEIIPTYTKHEAKQKVSELFANYKVPTSQQIRDIIDLIEEE